MHPDGEKTA